MGKKNKVKGSIPYALGMVSYNIEYLFISYLSYAMTNSFGISAITSGSIFLISRIFDGFTDILAAFIIDYFNPKIGKSRVYDLLHIPLWICLVLVFSVPNIGATGKVIWIFVFYNLLQSVIATLMNVAEPLRLQRSFKEEARIKVMTVTSIATMLFSVIAGMALPILIKQLAVKPHGWTIISLIYAIPFMLFGTLRFILLPELPENNTLEKVEKISIKDTLKALYQNKYALLYGGVMICWGMFNTFIAGSVTYYFQYIYKDISAQSFVSLATIFIIVFIAFIPKLIKKFGEVNSVRIGLTMAMICQLAKLIFPTNLIWIVTLQFLSTCGIMTLSFMKPLLTIKCITYGKWKTGKSTEAAYSTVNSLSDKIGLGLGGFAMGGILQMANYNGALLVQSDTALFTIKMLYTAIPAALAGIALLFLFFFDLDKHLPIIEKDLEERELYKTVKI